MTNTNTVTKEFTGQNGKPTMLIWDKSQNTLGFVALTARANAVAELAPQTDITVIFGDTTPYTTDAQIVPSCPDLLARPTVAPSLPRNLTDSCLQQPSMSIGVSAVGIGSISLRSGWEDDRSGPVCQPG